MNSVHNHHKDTIKKIILNMEKVKNSINQIKAACKSQKEEMNEFELELDALKVALGRGHKA